MMYKPLDPVCEVTKLTKIRAAALVCIITSFFFSLGLSYITKPLVRKIYSTSLGFVVNFYFWGIAAWFNLFLVISTYLIMLLLPRNLASKAMVWWAGSILLIVHYYYYTAPVERTTGMFLPLMFSFAKIHMVSWNLYDAGLLSDPEASKYMTDREKYYAKACVEKPGFLDWIHYLYFVSTCGAGPMHEYRDFIEFINYTGDIKSMPVGANLWPALQRFGESIVSVVVFLVLSQKIPATYM